MLENTVQAFLPGSLKLPDYEYIVHYCFFELYIPGLIPGIFYFHNFYSYMLEDTVQASLPGSLKLPDYEYMVCCTFFEPYTPGLRIRSFYFFERV